jgi:hypothetical protein
MRLISLITLSLAAVALTAGTASSSGTSGFFKTPNGKIYCGWVTGTQGSLVCGIKNHKLKPKPKNNCAKLGVDYVGNRIAMSNKSKAKVQACAGDAGPFANPKATKVLKAGKAWRRGVFTCTTTISTVRCKNKAKHGFELHSNGPYQIF